MLRPLNNSDTPEPLLTIDEVQAFLRIPKPTIYQYTQRGDLKAAKLGRHWRYRRHDVEQWVERQRNV